MNNQNNIIQKINRLRKEKNAIILAHYYQTGDIQDIADFVGDSLALAQEAEKTKAKVIVMSGVHFMAETVKLLCPDSKVLIPDKEAGCSLADSCPADEFEKFKNKHPHHKVISYINTTVDIKALTDVTCTSTNAVNIVESFNKNEKLIFAPDRNLGNYINSITGRNMLLWDGACHVHEEFSLERILKLKEENKDAKIIAHPECQRQILIIADHIGSTSSLLNYVIKDNAKKYIVATESGIIHQMKKAMPNKIFIAGPPKDSTCGCTDCNFMKLNTMEKIYACLINEKPTIEIEEEKRKKAVKPIIRMLELSKTKR